MFKKKTMDQKTGTELRQEAAYAHDRNEFPEIVYDELLNQINIWESDKNVDYSGKTLNDLILATLVRIRASKSPAATDAAWKSALKVATTDAVVNCIKDSLDNHVGLHAGALSLAYELDKLDAPNRALSAYRDIEKELRTGKSDVTPGAFKHVPSTPVEFERTKKAAWRLFEPIYEKHWKTCPICQERNPELSETQVREALKGAFSR